MKKLSHIFSHTLIMLSLILSFDSTTLMARSSHHKPPASWNKPVLTQKKKSPPAEHRACPSLTPTIDNTYTVTLATDTGAVGELRWAIQQSNANPPAVGTLNAINFNIPGAGPFTITPATPLPFITQPVFINGYSQPGAQCNTLEQGTNAVLKIILNGGNYTVGDANTGVGLLFDSGSDESILSGLVINQWIAAGVAVEPISSNTITGVSIVGNFFGTDVTGTVQMANRAGLYLYSATNTIVGTTALADRNLFAGSFQWYAGGACITSNFGQGTSIVNNLIGTDKTGTIALDNSQDGIQLYVEFSSGIGGPSPLERNIISGHLMWGIVMFYCAEILIQNNYIGTDVNGTVLVHYI